MDNCFDLCPSNCHHIHRNRVNGGLSRIDKAFNLANALFSIAVVSLKQKVGVKQIFLV